MPKPLAITQAEHLPRSRKWTAQLGVALILLGILALVTIASHVIRQEMLFGWLIVVSGIVESVHGFYLRKTQGFFLHLIPGIAAVPVALSLVTGVGGQPEFYPLAWILMSASYLMVLGLFRTIAAVRIRFTAWRWALLDGSATFLLGIVLWVAGPRLLRPWPLGIALGISLLLRGFSLIMFAMGTHKVEVGRDTYFRAA